MKGMRSPTNSAPSPMRCGGVIVTLGTLGYGDAVPMTVLGNPVASVTIFFGLIMIALPVGIIASAFASKSIAASWS